MSELFNAEILQLIEHLALRMKIPVIEGGTGNRKSKSKGMSVEFSDFREYSAGDDFRRIDWNAYGRFNKLYIKLYTEEREAPVSIFYDASASMGMEDKSIAARRFAGAVAYLSLCAYDTVSLYAVTDRTEQIKSSLRGRNSFPQTIEFLENLNHKNTTDLTQAVKNAGIKERRGISIVVSDFFSTGDFRDMLKFLRYKKQEVFICHILSPLERVPALEGSLRLTDSENGRSVDISMSAAVLETYKKTLNKFISDLNESCRANGVYYISLTSDMPIEKMVEKLIQVV